jgi:hypothetical protein
MSIDEKFTAKIGESLMAVASESFNGKTGLGSRLSLQFLERSYNFNYYLLGTRIEGCGGLWSQLPYHCVAPAGIMTEVKKLMS